METIVKDDLISRKAVHKELANLQMCVAGLRFGKGVLDEFMKKYRESVLLIVGKQPTVDAAPVVYGRWDSQPYYKVDGKGGVFKYCDFYYCSECKTERPMVPPYNYCPNCGAKMDLKG